MSTDDEPTPPAAEPWEEPDAPGISEAAPGAPPGAAPPGDHDALPHLPATDPTTIPPDQGDPGRP